MYPVLEKVKFVQGGKVLLKFSEGFEYRVTENVYLDINLAIGAELTPEIEHRLVAMKEFSDCRKKALDFLSRRPHSEYELKQKLMRKKEFSRENINIVLTELKELNYLNDEEFCRLYVDDAVRLRPEHGPGKIKQKLLAKGLDRSLIDATIREFSKEPDEEYEIVKELAHKKWSSYPASLEFLKKKSRLYRFLAGRGFSSSLVSRVMKEFTYNGKGSD